MFDVVVIEIAFLEHLEREVLVADDDLADLVEVVDADVAAVLRRPVVVPPADRDALALDDVRFVDDVGAGAGQQLEVVFLEIAGAVDVFSTWAGKIGMLPQKYRKFRQFSCLLLTRTMYLLSATGCSNLSNTSCVARVLQALVHHERPSVATTSSATTGWPSDQRAFGSIRKRYVIWSSETCQCVASAGM